MLPEVSKLNHSLKNKNQEDQIQISPEKKTVEKERFVTFQPITPVAGLCYKIIDSQIMQEIVLSFSKC